MNGRWASKAGIQGSIGCNNGVFGDPIVGTFKECRYDITGEVPRAPGATVCSAEHGSCSIPQGRVATVYYGKNGRWTSRGGVSGSIGCNNGVFGDPIVGTFKECRYDVTGMAPVNCQVSGWGNWGVCSTKCGRGVQIRSRSVQVAAQHGGLACPTLMDSQPCNTHACPPVINRVDCMVSSWSDFTACNKACGGGSQSQTRSVTRQAIGGGAACPTLSQSRTCNSHACPLPGAVGCANEHGTCAIPAGSIATVHYGQNGRWTQKRGVTGSIGCNNGVFGDPLIGRSSSAAMM